MAVGRGDRSGERSFPSKPPSGLAEEGPSPWGLVSRECPSRVPEPRSHRGPRSKPKGRKGEVIKLFSFSHFRNNPTIFHSFFHQHKLLETRVIVFITRVSHSLPPCFSDQKKQ